MRLSIFIRENMEQLLGEWELFARELLPPGKTLNQAALRDDAETLLRAIALDMETAQSRAQQTLKSKGASRLTGLSSHTHAHARKASAALRASECIAEIAAVLHLPGWG